ncbi:FHA domain-containing protein [Flavimobilis marinus]|nr:FHA domain-containing protein [Flavimobilis marinus]
MIERTVDGRQVVVTLGPDDVFDAMVWGMISHNDVPRVAAASRATIDGTTVVRYDVEGAVPLLALADRALRREQVLTLVAGVIDTLLEGDRYMIDREHFVVTREHLYVDPETCEPVVLCLPVRGREPDDVATVLRESLLQLWYDREQDRAYVGELVGALTATSAADLAGLSRAIKNIDTPRQGAGAPFAREGAHGGPVRAVDPTVGEVPVTYGIVPEAAGPAGPAAPPVGYGYAVPGSPGAPQPVAAAPSAQVAPAASTADAAGAPTGAPTSASTGAPTGAPVAPPNGEKPMTLLYLLQHYSQENKATYDRQRKERGRPAKDGATVVATAPAVLPPGFPSGRAADAPFDQTFQVGSEGIRAHVEGLAGSSAASPELVPAALRRQSTGEELPLNQTVMVIGRRRSRVDIAISGETVSKNHATVLGDAAGWSITDNGSTNGVDINGSSITPLEPVRLEDGDTIEIGDELLTFVVRHPAGW